MSATKPVSRAIVIAVSRPEVTEDEVLRSVRELELLLLGLGIDVVQRVVQKGAARATYLGEGKLREVAAMTGGPGEIIRGPEPVLEVRDDLLVVADDELSPGQQRLLRGALGVEVLDRTAVILRVFESRARTREAKVEVELARMQYELARVRDEHSLGDREGGGGRAARGHTNVELAKQRMRDRIAALGRELAQLQATAERRRLARAENLRVALVGYTNAGKSSIMRLLTGSEVFVEDKLFATLGTTVRQLSPPSSPPVLVIDTVGFIHRLPHALVASFKSTLAEAAEASLLVHVVDGSDPAFRSQLETTELVLEELGADAPTLLLLNKIDRLSAAERDALAAEFPNAIQLSALSREDGNMLRGRIVSVFAQRFVEQRFSIPYARQGTLAEFRDRLQIVDEDYGDMLTVTVRGSPEIVEKLAARLATHHSPSTR